jgi:hypothetical protein
VSEWRQLEIKAWVESRLGEAAMDPASVHLAAQFDARLPRDVAKANLDARGILFGCGNLILREHDLEISDAEER